MYFFKTVLCTSIMMSSSLFAMQITFPQPNAILSRKSAFIIKEYLKACATGDTKKALFLLTHQAKTPLAEVTDTNGLTGLMLAAGNGQIETLRAILPLHHPSEVAMKDAIKNYDAKAWAEYHKWEECVLALEKEVAL